MGLLLCQCFSGCSQFRSIERPDPFLIRYGKYLTSPVIKSPALRSDKISRTLTLSCYKMPISTLFRFLSDDFGVGLVYADYLSDKTVTAEFKETDFSSVLDVISRQVDSEIVSIHKTDPEIIRQKAK